jgi:hypothetical protein
MLLSTITLAGVLGLASTVTAHGFVDKLLIDGVEYEGYQPWRDPWTWPYVFPSMHKTHESVYLKTDVFSDSEPPPRIIRPIYSNYPVEDAESIDMQCGGYNNSGSTPAKLHAPVTAGTEIKLWWTDWPDSHHVRLHPSSQFFYS